MLETEIEDISGKVSLARGLMAQGSVQGSYRKQAMRKQAMEKVAAKGKGILSAYPYSRYWNYIML